MDKRTAINILKSRAVAKEAGAISNVAVTNVSFTDQDGKPFTWEEGSNSEGKPYAIANFNLMNMYGKKQAEKSFAEGEYQEACNTNLNARVPLEKGRLLQNALYATVDLQHREIDVKDEDGEPTGEKENALLIAKVVPNKAPSASDLKVDFDFGTEDEDVEEGMPSTSRASAPAERQ